MKKEQKNVEWCKTTYTDGECRKQTCTCMDILFMTEVALPSSEETMVLSIYDAQSIGYPTGKMKIDLHLPSSKGKG